ncbi:glycosyltransferase family 2 protein [Spirulina sp. CS-785/01]|uniref:glycosyltransferase n=1 Tax=Spirulina sp. CS-785/01 TaxID=3021716 RepID=UPI00232A8D30|nr:glycosyltransferase family 2 protein [Spirulina sp. CS-785/01]MDB9312758.1 glycosyltransferase family 2 protein [Spirulina sp. CS-785/01]
MSEQSWSNNKQEVDPLASLIPDWSDPEDEEEEFRSDFFQGIAGRRQKAAVLLMTIWGVVIALHLVSWGFWLVLSITGICAVYLLCVALEKADDPPQLLSEAELATAPKVSLLVAAKNEEVVIGRLVKQLCHLDYPRDRYEIWAIDDHSNDQTPHILDQLAQTYPQLHVFHRGPGAGGGKSGALNQVLPQTQGDIIAVFDADATVSPNMLRRVVPLFGQDNIGAVQMRKTIANPSVNFWTKSQYTEMALDSYFQQQRIAMGGIGELRGNGQFVRRKALATCGGWNEETITDDLDLTIRLHLAKWDIGFCLFPTVSEEGVTRLPSLWHQRSRWAEGGYQRYLDYWRFFMSHRLNFTKTMDLSVFVLMQYLLPTAAIPDIVMVILRQDFPILSPLSALMLLMVAQGMIRGLCRIKPHLSPVETILSSLRQTVRGMVYMTHWFVVIPATTARMAVRPKRLKWVKTVHQGTVEEGLEAS